MVKLGIIGYGVRIDMLMDEFMKLPEKVIIKAVADINPERVKALMKKDGSPELLHKMELDKIDGMWRKCRMNPEEIHFYEDADEMLQKEELDGVLVGTNCDTHSSFAVKVLQYGLPLFLEKPVRCHDGRHSYAGTGRSKDKSTDRGVFSAAGDPNGSGGEENS